ncbi:MAG: hypothetical protein ACREMA_12115, partial [Longimicrobiales bacterium]
MCTLFCTFAKTLSGQQPALAEHYMTMVSLGRGWMGIGMAQVFPIATLSLPRSENSPLERQGLYATQPTLMFNLESPQSRIVLHSTFNFEGITQPWGELTFGGWGEGYIDKRHPHTFLHEGVLSINEWHSDGGGYSVSAGKGFAPFGTDDPMSRPPVKYPTNHHLSQVLERWLLMGAYASPLFSIEAGVFGGSEPDSPWDFSNIESFPDSWSARITNRFGTGGLGAWPWEFAVSVARIAEEHEDGADQEHTLLFNAAVRHEDVHEIGGLYGLLEASWSDPEQGSNFFSVLGEGRVVHGIHQPYARIEYARRPEFVRAGSPASSGFFRYDPDAEPIGSTRWLIGTAGYGVTGTPLPFSGRPFIELQWN